MGWKVPPEARDDEDDMVAGAFGLLVPLLVLDDNTERGEERGS
jgi:hypothetical protein